jgi:hypothetical protein
MVLQLMLFIQMVSLNSTLILCLDHMKLITLINISLMPRKDLSLLAEAHFQALENTDQDG